MNRSEEVEKLHRAVMVLFSIPMFRQDTAMKGIMTMYHIISSDLWLQNCQTFDWLFWSGAKFSPEQQAW